MKRSSSMLQQQVFMTGLAVLLLTVTACHKSKEYEYTDDDNGGVTRLTIIVTDEAGNATALPEGTVTGVYVAGPDGSVTFQTVGIDGDGKAVLSVPAQRGGRLLVYSPYQTEWGADAFTAAQTFKVRTDQTAQTDYYASDLTTGAAETVAAGTTQVVTLSHLLARVVIHVIDETWTLNLRHGNMQLLNMNDEVSVSLNSQTVTTVNSSRADITMHPYILTDHRLSVAAIVAPQQKGSGEPFMEFNIDGNTISHAMPELADMPGGKTFILTLRMTETGLVFDGSYITDWDYEEENSLFI